MSKRQIQSTSRKAWQSVKDTTMLSNHQQKIVSALTVLGEAISEDIAKHLRMKEMQVYRRMSELVEKGMVMDTGKEKKTSSGRQAIVYALAAPPTCIGKPPEKKENKKETVISPTLF